MDQTPYYKNLIFSDWPDHPEFVQEHVATNSEFVGSVWRSFVCGSALLFVLGYGWVTLNFAIAKDLINFIVGHNVRL